MITANQPPSCYVIAAGFQDSRCSKTNSLKTQDIQIHKQISYLLELMQSSNCTITRWRLQNTYIRTETTRSESKEINR